MSNPPFGSPLQIEDQDDFSFPIEATNDHHTIDPLPIEEISLDSLPSTSLPISNYQDLSMFLDHEDQDFPLLLGQFPTTQENNTNDWVRLLEQVDQLDDHVQQGADGSSSGQEVRHRPINDHDHQGGESSSIKKLDHNAKERVRRLKLNETYLALRSLLPNSKRAKEKWSAPYMIDRALEYIPQLQAEIEKLTHEKTNMLSALGKKQAFLVSEDQLNAREDEKTLTVSINEVKRGEVIVQICEQTNKLMKIFSNLIERLEGVGMQVLSASSLSPCNDRSCFHIHVQMGENPLEADYVAELHKKLISWLS